MACLEVGKGCNTRLYLHSEVLLMVTRREAPQGWLPRASAQAVVLRGAHEKPKVRPSLTVSELHLWEGWMLAFVEMPAPPSPNWNQHGVGRSSYRHGGCMSAAVILVPPGLTRVLENVVVLVLTGEVPRKHWMRQRKWWGSTLYAKLISYIPDTEITELKEKASLSVMDFTHKPVLGHADLRTPELHL